MVWYRIAIHIIYASRKFWRILINFDGCDTDCQTAKFNSLLNFPAIWYVASWPIILYIPLSKLSELLEPSHESHRGTGGN